ncbi:MAG: hypothetical protein GEEBNDBF_02389 [bacterium]|nr:hypothetical protein [bacterium]
MSITIILGYLLLGAGAAFFIWSDAEFRPIERLPFAVLGFLAWPLALPWYLITRPESVVQDLTYSKSHQHYKDYVKQKGRDIGEGVAADLERREEEARLEKERAEKRRREQGPQAFEEEDDDEPKVQKVVIGDRPPPAAAPTGPWGNLPGEEGTPALPTAPRQGYAGDTRIGSSVRDRIYGTGGHAFEEGGHSPAEQSSSQQASEAPKPAAGGWALEPPAPPSPAPPAPRQAEPPTRASIRSRLYGDEDLAVPGIEEPRPPFQDHNLERLIEDGQLREAHRVAKRMLEIAARLGEAEKQAAYQQYFQDLERRIAASEVPLDD